MANLSDLRQSVRVFANQCPDITIDKFTVEALREFCRLSWYYQEVKLINLVASQAAYTLTASSANNEVIGVDFIKREGSPDFNTDTRDYTDSTTLDGGNGFTYDHSNVLTLYSTPTASVTNGLKADLVLMPIDTTTTIPDEIYRHYKEAIVAGALSYILMLQNEAWTNPQLAQMMQSKFTNGVFAAKGQRARRFQAGNLKVKSRRFSI